MRQLVGASRCGVEPAQALAPGSRTGEAGPPRARRSAAGQEPALRAAWKACRSVRLKAGNNGLDLDRLAVTEQDLSDATAFDAWDLGVDLVGAHLEQGFVFSDGIADRFEPAGDSTFGDGLAELRHHNIDEGHGLLLVGEQSLRLKDNVSRFREEVILERW